jgi:hypothetical protein
VIEAFLWGALASGTLLIGAIIAYVSRPGPKFNAVVMAAGAGLLERCGDNAPKEYQIGHSTDIAVEL